MMSETFDKDIRAKRKRKAEAPRMIITKHVVQRKEKKSRTGKTKTSKKKRVEPVDSNKSEDADEGIDGIVIFSENQEVGRDIEEIKVELNDTIQKVEPPKRRGRSRG